MFTAVLAAIPEVSVIAGDALSTVPIPPIDSSEIVSLLAAIGGASGGGAMGVTVLVSQLFMLILRSKLGSYAGKYQLGALYGVTTIVGVTSLRATGLGWAAAALHANTLSALQVFGHQVFKQLTEKKQATPPVTNK